MSEPNHESPRPSPASKLLADLAQSLDQHHVRYLVIGGQAVIEHGYRRYTEDIDVELSLGPWDMKPVLEIAQQLALRPKFQGAVEQASLSLLLPLQAEEEKVAVDLSFSPSPYLELAIERATRHEIAGYAVSFAAVEDLIIRKVIANRPRDREDVDQLLLRHEQRIDLTYIDQWLGRFEQVVEDPLRQRFDELLQASRR